jgi:hypothetical protein
VERPPRPGRYADRHGKGAARRRFAATSVADGVVRAEMEDEMHHFRIALTHDGEQVVDVTGTPVRWPWSTCFDSPDALAALRGCPLTVQASTIGSYTNVKEQCTHQFDLTALAIGHAWRVVRGGATTREYLTVVPDWSRPPFSAYLWRDREPLLAWLTDGAAVLGPRPFTGVALRSRFLQWCESNLDADLTEAAQILRRAVWISPARTHDLEACADAQESNVGAGVCYTAQPQRISVAIRSRGSLRDYSNTLLGLDRTSDTVA